MQHVVQMNIQTIIVQSTFPFIFHIKIVNFSHIHNRLNTYRLDIFVINYFFPTKNHLLNLFYVRADSRFEIASSYKLFSFIL